MINAGNIWQKRSRGNPLEYYLKPLSQSIAKMYIKLDENKIV